MDKIYREKFPNPVKPQPYQPAASSKGSSRVVLLEMFTGSGCGPCVSADLAMDAVMERYPSDAIVPVAYHANIPLPDPMVVPGGDGRREYYKVRGVPTFNIDGALGQLGGGARANTPGTYGNYISKIDKELAVPPAAAISLSAIGEGELVSVTANVSKLASKSKDLRLHLLLVERELHYMVENGVRFHPMVVRAMAGDRGAGIPIKGNGTTKPFDLTAIRGDITSTLTPSWRNGGRVKRPAPRDATTPPTVTPTRRSISQRCRSWPSCRTRPPRARCARRWPRRSGWAPSCAIRSPSTRGAC
jgi:thiol-disulfide isomerase/thioredoxin